MSPRSIQRKELRERDGVSKRSSRHHSPLEQIRSPKMLRELLKEAEISVVTESPSTRAGSVFSDRTAPGSPASFARPTSLVAPHKPVPGIWSKNDWKALDRAYSDE